VWPDGYIYIWWDLPKELIKVEFGNDKTDDRDSTCYQHTHPWHNESASGRKQVKQRDTVWCDARRDLFKFRLVFLCQKRYTREFVIGIEAACASWLGVTVACRQPPSASSWATFCKGRMRLEWRLCCTASSAAAEVDFSSLYAHYSRRLVGNSRVDSSVSRCTRPPFSRNPTIF
jgi:hypothetical protein